MKIIKNYFLMKKSITLKKVKKGYWLLNTIGLFVSLPNKNYNKLFTYYNNFKTYK